MTIAFTKYHGTGNDFILIDDRQQSFDISNTRLVREMCSRRFGIGADGLILLREKEGFDFEMVYFNSDGNLSTMCGNGGRCIVKFAFSLGLFEQHCIFIAVDGAHQGQVLADDQIKIKMGDVKGIVNNNNHYILDTGSPHYVLPIPQMSEIDIKKEGAKIRYSKNYEKEGINVNFLELNENNIGVATYERGVEDETFSCGTGVTAAALVAFELNPQNYQSPVSIQTKGGTLSVFFQKESDHHYTDIWLEGPVIKTFTGVWE